FQAEDGIRDPLVTGVQTCALPISFYSGDIDPDRPDERGIQKHFGKEFDWSTIRAWAWGYSRVIDYLVTDPDIDATKIIAVGHSRSEERRVGNGCQLWRWVVRSRVR